MKLKLFLTVFCLSFTLSTMHAAAADSKAAGAGLMVVETAQVSTEKDSRGGFRVHFAKALKTNNQKSAIDAINDDFSQGECTWCCRKQKYIDEGSELLKHMVQAVSDIEKEGDSFKTSQAVEQAADIFLAACVYLSERDREHTHTKKFQHKREFPKYLPKVTEETDFDKRLKTKFWTLVMGKMPKPLKVKEPIKR